MDELPDPSNTVTSNRGSTDRGGVELGDYPQCPESVNTPTTRESQGSGLKVRASHEVLPFQIFRPRPEWRIEKCVWVQMVASAGHRDETPASHTALAAVLNHTLRARDLYLLDARIREVEPVYVFNGLTSTFEPSTSTFREYPTLDSVIFPLHNYFAILLAHHPNAHGLPVHLLSYLTLLHSLAADYDWDAVLGYHTLFFNRRVREMEADGDYSAWSGPDVSLLCTHVYPHRKSSYGTSLHSPESVPRTRDPRSIQNQGHGHRTAPRHRHWRTRIRSGTHFDVARLKLPTQPEAE
ncbi:hypothetical protein B0H11DRAFT_1927593 [Mycena galericulata]|nr:hypothetical protein B0H11DRAFT_1927593 [Mycena galericulata]